MCNILYYELNNEKLLVKTCKGIADTIASVQAEKKRKKFVAKKKKKQARKTCCSFFPFDTTVFEVSTENAEMKREKKYTSVHLYTCIKKTYRTQTYTKLKAATECTYQQIYLYTPVQEKKGNKELYTLLAGG